MIARRVPMTSMPELVAAFHSLVGMAAVLVAAGALYAPDRLRHRHRAATSTAQSLIEMSLGVAIGAITFTGSVIAFLKLSGRMSGAPIMLPGRHVINIALGAGAGRSSSYGFVRVAEPCSTSGCIAGIVVRARRAASSSRSAAPTCRS